jgi:energy-coupling factor transporter ATP-binding protein EcfA2
LRECPYRGLLPFEQGHEEVFCGRERLTAELAVRVARRAASGGMVVVTGASGAGKSSLLRAGLLPVLARGVQVKGSQDWPCAVITPAGDPLTELAAALAALGGGGTAVREQPVREPGKAHRLVRQAVAADAARRHRGRPPVTAAAVRLVLIVDQFEQVFTLNPGPGGEAMRRAFITALCAAATGSAGPGGRPAALVVIAVRGDFWDRCAAYPELARELQDGQFVVGPMTESELRLAITGPAEAAGLAIDDALVGSIVSDLRATGGDEVGALPLLSQAMQATWEHREGDRLTSRGYDLAGGVSLAVQTSADDVYNALSAQQEIARAILRTMTVASRDGRFTRRPVNRADLYAAHPDADRFEVDQVLEAFAARRLIVLGDGTAQLAHDALLRAWPRLRGWLDEDKAALILYGQLADDAAAWHGHDDDRSFLYRGTQLAAIQQATATWSADPGR